MPHTNSFKSAFPRDFKRATREIDTLQSADDITKKEARYLKAMLQYVNVQHFEKTGQALAWPDFEQLRGVEPSIDNWAPRELGKVKTSLVDKKLLRVHRDEIHTGAAISQSASVYHVLLQAL